MSKCTNKHNISLSDEIIIEMYWQREERAIEETDIKYGPFLFRIAYGILDDRLAAKIEQREVALVIISRCLFCVGFCPMTTI